MDSCLQLGHQIQRSAEHLANLKADQIIKDRLYAIRAQEAQRRVETKRKMALGTMLVDAGMSELEPAEVLGALLAYRELVVDPASRERHTARGAHWLAEQKSSRHST